MSRDNDNCVLLFAKYPAAGEVKTRLAQEIGTNQAAGLYTCFIEDSVSLLRKLNVQIRLCFQPASAEGDFVRWLGRQYHYMPQAGADLGERMRNAFDHAFEEDFARVVVIGSDSPDLPEDFLRQAFRELAAHDVVLGPTTDGGYYLIGFTKEGFLPKAFDNIAWSSDSVFEQTISILGQHKRKVCLLPLWYDVDTLADLRSMLSRNEYTAFSRSRTLSYLTTNKSWSSVNV
jgi:rSAM/selenodomain-associated transferase 1